jgi:hypothetical protein
LSIARRSSAFSARNTTCYHSAIVCHLFSVLRQIDLRGRDSTAMLKMEGIPSFVGLQASVKDCHTTLLGLVWGVCSRSCSLAVQRACIEPIQYCNKSQPTCRCLFSNLCKPPCKEHHSRELALAGVYSKVSCMQSLA